MKSKIDKERLPFFVYGTLLPGQPNTVLWGESIVAQEKALLANGRLYDMGSFPMLVEAGDEPVCGLLTYVTDAEYETVLARLDRLEGVDTVQPNISWYRRVVREVEVANGRSVPAWVYIGHQAAVQGMMPIPAGDWAAYVAKTFQDIAQWWMDVASVHGLNESPDK